MDWRSLLHNRWFLGALGAAGLAGAYVLYKKRGQTDLQAGAGAQQSPAYSGGVGGFDSTGTDVAHWLGDQQARWDEQMRQFLDQIQASNGVAQVPTGSTSSGLPPSTPTRRYVVTVPTPSSGVSVRRPPTRRT